jgi:hypothetical protein
MSALSMPAHRGAICPQSVRNGCGQSARGPFRNVSSTTVQHLLGLGRHASPDEANALRMLRKDIGLPVGYTWVMFGFRCVRNRSRAFAKYSGAPSKTLPSLVLNRDRSIVLNWDTPQSDASRPGQGGNASVTHGALLSRYRRAGTRKEGPNAGV